MADYTQGNTKVQGIFGLAPKAYAFQSGKRGEEEVSPTFISQALENHFSFGTFSVFFTLDANLQSKIIFGEP